MIKITDAVGYPSDKEVKKRVMLLAARASDDRRSSAIAKAALRYKSFQSKHLLIVTIFYGIKFMPRLGYFSLLTDALQTFIFSFASYRWFRANG
ncbi:hypothetical protein [Cronobacter dublinensis]|uniref:hypothetical protein n=1 Tax=Cronobacter dublinensis TaxID=413497 RepID=UPI000CFD970E|nr:hypothetical protein [Cronobacter dublinensis]